MSEKQPGAALRYWAGVLPATEVAAAAAGEVEAVVAGMVAGKGFQMVGMVAEEARRNVLLRPRRARW